MSTKKLNGFCLELLKFEDAQRKIIFKSYLYIFCIEALVLNEFSIQEDTFKSKSQSVQ